MTTASLGGVPLINTGAIGWRLTQGVDPHQRVFEMEREGAKKLLALLERVSGFEGGANVKLEIDPQLPNIGKLRIDNLSILSVAPASAPYLLGLLVSDVRWKWPRKHVMRSYNVRRRSGNRRILVDNPSGLLQIDAVDDIIYAPWSLREARPVEAGADSAGSSIAKAGEDVKNKAADNAAKGGIDKLGFGAGFSLKPAIPAKKSDIEPLEPPLRASGKKAWSAKDVLADVLGYVCGPSGFDVSNTDFEASLPIENLELDDPGHEAISRVLAYIPGASIYIDRGGKAIVTNHFDGSEVAEIDKYPVPIAGPLLHIEADLSAVTPVQVDVLFEPEDELRFNFQTETDSDLESTFEPLVAGDIYPLELENVLPLPDPKLVVSVRNGDKTKDITYAQGTWVKITDKLLKAWVDAHPPVIRHVEKQPVINLAAIRKFWFTGGYNYLIESGILEDQVWMRRIASLMQHYRQTFRISRFWMDRIRSLRAYRAALLDSETGTRAPADVYARYATLPTQRRLAMTREDADLTRIAINVNGYADDLLADDDPLSRSNPKTKQAKVAPAVVQVLDAEQGIIHVDYRLMIGDIANVAPANVKIQDRFYNNDDPNVLRKVDPVTGKPIMTCDPRDPANVLAAGELTPEHKLAIVLTVSAACPNGVGRLYRVPVTMDKAKALLPKSIAERLPAQPRGPAIQVKIGAGLDTARFAWIDKRKTEIARAVALGDIRNDELLVDKDVIDKIATAAAASVYSRFVTRREGAHVTALNAGANPVGRIAHVSHDILQAGRALTTLNMPDDQQALNILSLLPDGVRRRILRLVQP